MLYWSFYLVVVIILISNVISFALMAFDKKRAQRRNQRVPESTFFFLSCMGGIIGIVIASQVFRHKTKKWTFWFKVFFGIMVFLMLIYLIYKIYKGGYYKLI